MQRRFLRRTRRFYRQNIRQQQDKKKPDGKRKPIPVVSVLMVAKDMDPGFLKKAIHSVLEQKGVPFELIIVEHGSMNSQTSRVLRNAEDDDRVIVLRLENIGIIASCNAALLCCRGEFVAFLESDDLMLPDRLDFQTRYLKNHREISLVAGQMQYIDGEEHSIRGLDAKKTSEFKWTASPAKNQLCFVGRSTVCYRKSDALVFITDGNFPSDKQIENLDHLQRLCRLGDKVAILDEVFCKYRMHVDKITNYGNAWNSVEVVSEKGRNSGAVENTSIPNYRYMDREGVFFKGGHKDFLHAGAFFSRLENPLVLLCDSSASREILDYSPFETKIATPGEKSVYRKMFVVGDVPKSYLPLPLRKMPYDEVVVGKKPRQSDEPVVANLASIPNRMKGLYETVASLIHQVDKLNIYLNNYKKPPAFLLENSKINFVLNGVDYNAKAKMLWHSKEKGWLLSVDDDIAYPPDYAQRMIKTCKFLGTTGVATGVRGIRFSYKFRNYYKDRCVNYRPNNELEHASLVDVLSTGDCCIHSSNIENDFWDSMSRNDQIDPACNLYFSRKGIERYVVPRKKGWVRATRYKSNGGLHQKNSMGDDSEKLSQSYRIVREIVGDRPAVVYKTSAGIGNFIMSTPFLSQLNDPILYFERKYHWFDEIQSISPWPVAVNPGDDKIISMHKTVYAPWGNFPKAKMGHFSPSKEVLNGKLREVEAYMKLLDATVDVSGLKTVIKPKMQINAFSGGGKLKVVLINGSKDWPRWRLKRWPISNFVEVAKQLKRNCDAEIIFLGADYEKKTGEAIGDMCLNLAGKTTFGEAVSVLNESDLVISTDTGLMHAADAVGAKGIAMFGFTSVKKNGPWNGNMKVLRSDGGVCPHFPCWPTPEQMKCRDSICMKAISVDMVMSAVHELLEESL